MNETLPVRQVGLLLDKVTASRHAHETARHLYEDRLAPDFSPLQFLWLDELMWSKLIGWLLNPRETHGQKGRFLHLFMRYICHSDRCWSEEECDRAIVMIEHSFDDGRIDILIQSDDRVLIIENKPYAADQDNQLHRYFRYAEKLNRDAMIVYLTSYGYPPSPDSLGRDEVESRQADGTLILQSYRGLALSATIERPSWLDACRLACRSPRVTSFIEEIQTQINAEFSGVRHMNESDAIVDHMMSTSDAIISSFQIANHHSILKNRLTDNLVSILKDSELVNLIDSCVRKDGFIIHFDIDRNLPYVLVVQAFDILAVGLWRRDGKDSRDPIQIANGERLYNELKSLGKCVKWGGDRWAWVHLPDINSKLCPLPSDFWSNPEPWVQIAADADGDRPSQNIVAAKIIAAVLKVRDTLADAQETRAMAGNVR